MMKHTKRPFLAAMMILLIALAGCGESENKSGKIQPPLKRSQKAVQVNVVEVRRGDIFQPISATGTVMPQREANLGFKIAGKIQRIYVEEGDEVEAGVVLSELDRDDLLLAQRGARADLAMAKAALQEAKLNLENLEREKTRIARLHEKKVVAQQKYDDIQTAHSMAASRIEMASAQLARARANLALTDQRLKDARLRAPFSGSISRKVMREAELTAPNMPVVTILNIDRVKVEVEIPEIMAPSVKKNAPVSVEIDALPQTELTGRVSRINSAVNPISRTFKVEIDIPNRDHSIKAGMFARITIKTDVIRDAIVIPPKALTTTDDGRSAVFVVTDNRAVLTKVTTGTINEHLVEVKEGIAAGDRIIVAGNFGLQDHTMVAPNVVTY
ncbi:MAG: efflux RND transporter periplasmic adaptor subunit [Deltaproteobacteria bacterium]|nr:efflux RND transporter periplasmic adaptor subunit [Deltaproteobacteria bacterium]